MKKAAHHRDRPAEAAEGPSAGATAGPVAGDPGAAPTDSAPTAPAPGSTAPTATARPDAAERWTVDGIEDSPRGPLARLEREDGSTFDLPLGFLPGGIREGDLLEVRGGPDGVTVRRLGAETLARRGAMQTQLDALNAAGKGEPDDGEITV